MSGFWRRCRFAFRCVRFFFWAVVLLLLGFFAWLNLVGLPGFLKTRLVAALHEHNVQLEFSRMRVRAIHGLVCDEVRIGPASPAIGPEFTASEVQLRINFPALLHRHLLVDGLVLRQGRLNIPVAADESIIITNIQGELRILPDDTWSLDQFKGTLAGLNFNFAGAIAHAPEFRQWQMFATTAAPEHGPQPTRPSRPGQRGNVQSSLRGVAEALKQVHFAGQPQVNVRLDGDARDVHSITFTISTRVPGVDTPWFSVSNFEFAAHVMAPTNMPLYNGPADGFWTNLQPFRLDWMARGTNFKSTFVSAAAMDGSGVWGDPHNLSAFAAGISVRAQGVQSRWCSLHDLNFAARACERTNVAAQIDPAWGVWTNLQAFQVDWLARGFGLKSDQVELETLVCDGAWDAPELTLNDLSATIKTGALRTDSRFNVNSRQLVFSASSTVDPHLAAPFLDEKLRKKLADISWSEPPRWQMSGTLPLPILTSQPPDWPGTITSNLTLAGHITFTNTQLPGIVLPISAQTHFNYSNQVWQLAETKLSAGRIACKLNAEGSQATSDFHCQLESILDTASVATFLPRDVATNVFQLLKFRAPIALTLEASGNWRVLSTLTVTGQVAITNFAIRDQWIDNVAAAFSYTNQIIRFFHPHLARAKGREKCHADEVVLDIPGQKLFLHGARGNISSDVVGKAIGPETYQAMEPYHFLAIPEATADGCIPLKQKDGNPVVDDADLWVNIPNPAPFRWLKFETPAINGTIHWLSNYLILTNVSAQCYGGTAHGWGSFNLLTPGDGTEFSFFIDGTNVDFNAMGRALWSPTNQLRGALSGTVMITRANSSDWRTWNGFGQANLQNGLLWNAPILGVMSLVLDKLTPGLDIGNNRATEANGRYVMTNGVIFTDTLVIHSGSMRIFYNGTVDLDENVSARARAELLRNTPLVGQLVSMVLTPVSLVSECEVTGTLDEPKISPIYIPFSKVLAAPLHPLRTVEEIFGPAPTNTPAKP